MLLGVNVNAVHLGDLDYQIENVGKNPWATIKINSQRPLAIKIESCMPFSGLKPKPGKQQKFQVYRTMRFDAFKGLDLHYKIKKPVSKR